MSRALQTETMETDLGTMYAVKRDRNEPWRISHPWGDAALYGTVAEVRRLLKQIKTKHEEVLSD